MVFRATRLTGQIQTPTGPQTIRLSAEEIDPIVQWKVKPADESVTSDTSANIDSDLAGFILKASQLYAIEGYLFYIQNTGDLQVIFDATAAPQSSAWTLLATDGNEVTETDHLPNIESGKILNNITDNLDASLQLSGIIQTHATDDAVLNFLWAQGSSSANATTLRAGSWIRVTQLDIVS